MSTDSMEQSAEAAEDSTLVEIKQRLDALEEENKRLRDQNENLAERVEELEAENSSMQETLNLYDRVLPAFTGMVNGIHGFDENEALDPSDIDLIPQAKRAGQKIDELVGDVDDIDHRTDGLEDLLSFREKVNKDNSKTERMLAVVARAKRKAKREKTENTYLTAKEFAEAYECAVSNAYREMEKFPQEVPGTFYKEAREANRAKEQSNRRLPKRVRFEFSHPALHRWISIHEDE